MKSRRRAFALLFVLGMVTVVTMLMVALFAGALGPAAQSHTLNRQVSGLYVAEAGLQSVLQELQNSRSWAAGYNRKSTLGKVGTFTVTFPASPPYTNQDSVNNLGGTAAVASYRGPATVPKGTALIVVNAEVDGAAQRLEALVGEGLNVPVGTAMLGGDDIHLAGDVKVNGIKAFNDAASVPSDVHSNKGGNAAGVISFSGGGAKIQGNLSIVNSNPASLSLGGATVTGTTKTGAAARQFPGVNILGTIASKSSRPAPAINPAGPTTLASGEYYHTGDLTVNGDLDLKDAKLYVSGKVTINGSIQGKGALYSAATTRLQGSATIAALEGQSVALMSEGDVTLEGFDGNAYLQSLADSDSTFATQWSQVKQTVQDLQGELSTGHVGDWDHDRSAHYFHVLGPWNVAPTHNGYDPGLLTKMTAKINAQAPSPTGNFMAKRLGSIEHIFKGGAATYGNDRAALDKFYLSGDVGALFDSTIDEQETATWSSLKNVVNTINYDHLGSSYFQGMVYSNGKIVATNELTVLGGVFAKGEINLVNGVTLTYIQKLFESGGVMSNSGLVNVLSWMGP